MGKGWERPDWWYEPDCDDSFSCAECKEKEKEMDRAAIGLAKLIRHMYNHDGFIPKEFENGLEDLCNALNMNFPKQRLNILEKKKDLE